MVALTDQPPHKSFIFSPKYLLYKYISASVQMWKLTLGSSA